MKLLKHHDAASGRALIARVRCRDTCPDPCQGHSSHRTLIILLQSAKQPQLASPTQLVTQSHAQLNTRKNMDHDALIRLDVYVGSNGSRIGYLKSHRAEDELMFKLREVAHAASGSDTLDMVYIRSESERASFLRVKETFGRPSRLLGRDLHARIIFIPQGAGSGQQVPTRDGLWYQHHPLLYSWQASGG
jgi:hypothetical protein